MNVKQLFEAFTDIDEVLIKEADIEVQSKAFPLRKMIITLGACASLLALFILGNQTFLNEELVENMGLPGTSQLLLSDKIQEELDNRLESIEVGFTNGSMGFEGYMAYDISDLVNQNPWNESTMIKRLPLFRNPFDYETSGAVMNTSFDDMVATLKNVAKTFNIEVDDTKIIVNYGYHDMLREIKYIQDGLRIEVRGDLSWDVWFDPSIELPTELNFSYDSSTYEDMIKVAEYLKQEYGFVLMMNEPVTNIYGGDFNIYAEQSYDLGFYEGSGSLIDQILNYNFNQIRFACDDNSDLWLIRYTNNDLSEKIGDYPIISVEEATELLIDGQYLTTVWEPFTDSQSIRDVELIYRSGHDKIFMPYYRFFVELPSMKRENGLNTYGAYYVPAIKSQYISNMPLWDERFN